MINKEVPIRNKKLFQYVPLYIVARTGETFICFWLGLGFQVGELSKELLWFWASFLLFLVKRCLSGDRISEMQFAH